MLVAVQLTLLLLNVQSLVDPMKLTDSVIVSSQFTVVICVDQYFWMSKCKSYSLAFFFGLDEPQNDKEKEEQKKYEKLIAPYITEFINEQKVNVGCHNDSYLCVKLLRCAN
jgi:hypothetical protein